jgi:octaprenyl-diphosphate synthase
MPQTLATQKKELLSRHVSRQAFDLVSAELALVEDEFERQAASNIQVINYLGDYLRESGGKRVRPALLILATYAAGGDAKRGSVIRLATVMEMIHTATLVHDDIIDNADVRRNRSSINARFGNQAAVLMGDWLYMTAFQTALGERSLEILDILTRLTRKMTEGEIIQMTKIGDLAITKEEYLDILRRKTAYLFEACCEVGAILGKVGDAERRALTQFGLDLGIAFQLSDDMLDLTADDAQLGKAAGNDLLEGKLTLPLIMLLEHEPGLKPRLEQVMLNGTYDDLSREEIKAKLSSYGILDDVRTEANGFGQAARKSLDVLPQSVYRSCLEDILTFVIERKA